MTHICGPRGMSNTLSRGNFNPYPDLWLVDLIQTQLGQIGGVIRLNFLGGDSKLKIPKELLGRAQNTFLQKMGRDRMTTPLGILCSYHYMFHAYLCGVYFILVMSVFVRCLSCLVIILLPYLLSSFHVSPLTSYSIVYYHVSPFPFSLICLHTCLISYPLSLFA